jgi:hypothetical protein
MRGTVAAGWLVILPVFANRRIKTEIAVMTSSFDIARQFRYRKVTPA